MKTQYDIENRLLKACLKNDRTAQNQLYQRYKVAMFNVCQRYARNGEEAEDMLQEGFYQVFNNLKKYKGDGTLGSWIKGVMINSSLMYLRTMNRRLFPPDSFDDLGVDIPSSENVFEQFGARAILKIVQQLPPGYRAVFSLFAVEGFSHKEIAEKLAISDGTSRSQYARAKAMLKKLLEQHMLS